MTVATAQLPDFTGYATRFDRECSDGRTIKHSAFVHQDQQQVPLVWQHQHDNPENVLGHAILHQRADGVYTEAFFNETSRGQHAKMLVEHGDIKALSIFAGKLKQVGGDVVHGTIVEVSLVYRGANPDAYIQDVNLRHSSDGTDTMVGEAIIYPGEDFELYHADSAAAPAAAPPAGETVADIVATMSEKQKTVLYALVSQAATGSVQHSGDGVEDDEDVLIHAGDTNEEIDVNEVLDSLTEVQTEVFHALIGEALASAEPIQHSDDDDDVSDESENSEESTDSEDSEKKTEELKDSEKSEDQTDVDSDTDSEKLQHTQEGSANMKYNAFEAGATGTAVAKRPTLSHSELVGIVEEAQKIGSYKKAFEGFVLEHADYGIENIDILFPDARSLSDTPELIARQTEWVAKVLSATKHSPFAKVKTILADLTAEEARAKGYIKGTQKKDEVVTLLRRTTGPTTVYKKQKLDRDDIIDITDLDVVTWLKWEIRFMLNEEIARAILIGDGRAALNPDKIKDPAGSVDGVGIRSIANDDNLYAHQVELAANVSADVMIDEITRSRTNYRGSGSPTFYTTDKVLTDLLLLKDKMGRRLYETEAALAAAIRVKEIVAVEVMEENPVMLGIIVNLLDYTIGANKGGELTFFEDFDIDFNQQKYLLETRISGALTKPKSALVITRKLGTLAVATQPSFDGATNTITIPTASGVEYLIDGEVVTGSIVIDKATEVVAEAAVGNYLASNTTNSWVYTP